MTNISYFPLLKNVPILGASILQHAAIKKYEAKEIILRSYQNISFLLYVVKGTVRLNVDELNGNNRTLFWAGPGNFVCEAHFFHTPCVNANVEALTDVELAVFSREKAVFLLEKEQDFRMALITGLSAKVLAYGGEMVENSYSNDVLRLLRLLNELADEANVVHITQAELAMMCGVHRVTINRWCQVLKNQNLIEIERNKIILMEKSDTKQSW